MREFPRTARLNHLIHEIVAEEIERVDDERLGFLTVVAVEVEGDLRHATVWYSSMSGDKADGEDAAAQVAEALEEARRGVQAAIGRQARLKRTPELTFKPDPVLPEAERVESILRNIRDT
jgi:ribosome-binding factor A